MPSCYFYSVCVCAHAHVCVCVCVHTWVHVRIHTFMHMYVYVCIHVYVFMCVCVEGGGVCDRVENCLKHMKSPRLVSVFRPVSLCIWVYSKFCS